jgi:hypothetical protein
MLAKIQSASVVGIDAHMVEVEVDITARPSAFLDGRAA